MNVSEKIALWSQFKFQLPMIFCAVYVIYKQHKIIWKTLKMWWKWNDWNWNFRHWPAERVNSSIMGLVALVTFGFCHLPMVVNKRNELIFKNQIETINAKNDREKNALKLEQELEESANREREFHTKSKKPTGLPLYEVSPFFSFLSIVIIAPIVEESIFRYLIFEVFNKNNPLVYLLSGLSFIILHWNHGLFTFTAFNYLILTYLPMTIFFIWVYRNSKWNITYPMYYHFLWNLVAFTLAVGFKTIK